MTQLHLSVIKKLCWLTTSTLLLCLLLSRSTWYQVLPIEPTTSCQNIYEQQLTFFSSFIFEYSRSAPSPHEVQHSITIHFHIIFSTSAYCKNKNVAQNAKNMVKMFPVNFRLWTEERVEPVAQRLMSGTIQILH